MYICKYLCPGGLMYGAVWDARLYMRCANGRAIIAYSRVHWGLMAFHQLAGGDGARCMSLWARNVSARIGAPMIGSAIGNTLRISANFFISVIRSVCISNY